MKYLAIVNPAAGFGRCGRLAPDAIDRLRNAGIDIDTAETSGPGHAVSMAREAYEKGQRNFIAVGGDGTVFEIINGFLPEALNGDSVCLGFLPLGTGNSFLRDFTDKGLEHTIDAVVKGSKRTCDIIRFTHSNGVLYFINILALGFAANVCDITNRRFKRFGSAGYGLGVIVEVARLKSRVWAYSLDNGETHRQENVFISFCNSRFTGGTMMMAPGADTSDGQLDIIAAARLGRIDLLQTFPKIFKGTHLHHPAVKAERAVTLEFNISEETVFMIDGEIVKCIPEKLEVLPGAIDVIV